MCVNLTQLIEKHITPNTIENPLKEAYFLSLNKKGVGHSLLQKEIDRLLQIKIKNRSDHYHFLRDLLCVVHIMAENDFALDRLTQCYQVIKQSVYSFEPLHVFYMKLIKKIQGVEETIEEIEQYVALFKERYFISFDHHLLEGLEEIVLLFCLVSGGNKKQLNALSELVSYFSFFQDETLQGYIPFFVPQKAYNHSSSIALLALFKRLQDEHIQSLDKFSPATLTEIPLYLLIIERLIERRGLSVQPIERINSFGNYCRIENENISGLFTLSGKNTSIGSIKKQSVSIQSMGPQYDPLDEDLHFGITHFAGHSLLQKNQAGIKGWTRTTDSKDNSSCMGLDWIYFSLNNEMDWKLQLDVKKLSDKKLYFSFYVKSGFIEIDGKQKILPGALENFKGKCKEITLKNANSHMQMMTEVAQETVVFPLAGRDYFWGADFLIAYELKNNNKKFNLKLV